MAIGQRSGMEILSTSFNILIYNVGSFPKWRGAFLCISKRNKFNQEELYVYQEKSSRYREKSGSYQENSYKYRETLIFKSPSTTENVAVGQPNATTLRFSVFE